MLNVTQDLNIQQVQTSGKNDITVLIDSITQTPFQSIFNFVLEKESLIYVYFQKFLQITFN